MQRLCVNKGNQWILRSDALLVTLRFSPLLNPASPINFPIVLGRNYNRVAKINSTLSTGWPVNNIFLHYTPFQDTQPGNNATGRLSQLGGLRGVFPLELGNAARLFSYKFGAPLPNTVYISADFQGNGVYQDTIAFGWEDEVINFR